MADASLVATLGFAFSAGVATFFAPCAYPLLPGYVGYYVRAAEGSTTGHAGSGQRRLLVGAAVRGVAASVGVLATFLALGAVVALAGQSLVRYVVLFEPLVGVAFVVLGVALLADRAPTVHVPLPERRTSVVGFGLFGAVYALAAAGCTIPIVLAIVVRSLSLPPLDGVAVLGTYGAGVGLLLTVATVGIALGYDLGSRKLPRLAAQGTRIAGSLLVLAGLAQLYLSVVVYDAFAAL